MTITATCADPACKAVVYESTTIKAERHAMHAWAKAAREARAHAVRTGHDVHVRHGSRLELVATRCAKCGVATPGSATGICDPCLFKALGETDL